MPAQPHGARGGHGQRRPGVPRGPNAAERDGVARNAPFLACVTIFSAMRPTSLAFGTVVLMRSCSMSCVTMVLHATRSHTRHTPRTRANHSPAVRHYMQSHVNAGKPWRCSG